jgi:23S rRNA pseudouridine1911/1915/1917 synthase
MPERVYTFVVQEADIVSNRHEEKCRLDRYVLKQEDIDFSRSQVRKFILDGAITVNGHVMKPGYWVKAFDEITVTLPEPRPSSLVAEAIPLDIVYEDAQLLVINKPPGMVVHPAPGHAEGTLVHALLHHCQNLSGIGGIQRPGIVHRLDRDTSGVMLVAKTDDAHQHLSAQLSRHDITRIYYAVVHGRFAALSGTIEVPIGRHRGDRKKMAVVPKEYGRDAVTLYQVLEQYSGYTLLKIQLKTGRTHQIRVHLKHVQHPVVGDPVYGIASKNNLGMPRQALHAKCISFLHPTTEEQMSFETSLPEDMEQLLEKLRSYA